MKKAICFIAIFAAAAGVAFAQRGTTFTGTAVIYGSGFSTRTVTRPFTLIIERRTSDSDATQYLRTLEREGQSGLLSDIDDNDLGRFSIGSSLGLPINAVLIDRDEGDTRIRVFLKRWIGFGELRRGARSVDYPFTYLDIRIDPRTGRGEGTIIPAAKLRARGADTLEVEDFGTFPGRLMGVRMRGAQLP